MNARRRTREIKYTAALVLLALLLLFAVSGCATALQRFFTEEQEAWAKEHCTEGCAIVPAPLFRQMFEALTRRMM